MTVVPSAPLPDIRAFGAAVRDARAAAGWTQAELASRAGVSRQFVINLERGNGPRAELMRVFAVLRALGLAVALVDAVEPAPAPTGGGLDGLLDDVLGAALGWTPDQGSR